MKAEITKELIEHVAEIARLKLANQVTEKPSTQGIREIIQKLLMTP